MLSTEEIKHLLETNSFSFDHKAIDYGSQFRFADGAILNVYDSGKTHWSGKKTTAKQAVDELLNSATSTKIANGKSTLPTSSKKVFIVYGHDTSAREQLELLLRRLKLEPVVLQNLPAAGETIIEKLENNSEVRYACILLTPDDQGCKVGESCNTRHRARQNVVLEMGMFLAKLGRKKVAILHKGEIELPSDISGLLYLRFTDRIDEIKERIAAELQEAGFDINIKDLLS